MVHRHAEKYSRVRRARARAPHGGALTAGRAPAAQKKVDASVLANLPGLGATSNVAILARHKK